MSTQDLQVIDDAVNDPASSAVTKTDPIDLITKPESEFAPDDPVRRFRVLRSFTTPIIMTRREVRGRDVEASRVRSALARTEVSNVVLLAPAGVGKTAVVLKTALGDTRRDYREADLARIRAMTDGEGMAGVVKAMFDEMVEYRKEHGREFVLFIDEIHTLADQSPASMQAIKPYLARSGELGIRLIGATTDEEYHQYIRPDAALTQRFQRIIIGEMDRDMTIGILRDKAKKDGVDGQIHGDHLFELIYEYTTRHIPSDSQPRKSIMLFDAMVGKHIELGVPIDRDLLNETLEESIGVRIAYQIDPFKIKEELDKRVFNQDVATRAIERRMQSVVADLNNKKRPMASFFLSGSTGVGKAMALDTIVPVYTEDGSTSFKRHGDLVVGDKVFNREGAPVEVLGVFPQRDQVMYKITLSDGRTTTASAEHLWSVYTSKMRSNKHKGQSVEPKIMTTQDIVDAGIVRSYEGSDRQHLKYFLPAAGAVQWPAQDLDVDPYVMGVLIGNGCLTLAPLTISGDDEQVIKRVSDSIGMPENRLSDKNYNWTSIYWTFISGIYGSNGRVSHLQTKDFLMSYPELIGVKSPDRRIPSAYLSGSVDQRWSLVQGLFDTDGCISSSGGRFNMSYSTHSEGLAQDVSRLLFSLGVSNTIKSFTRDRDGRVSTEYQIHVKIGNEVKERFFFCDRKREIARRAASEDTRTRVKKFDMIGISSIERLDGLHDAVCIYVADEEHLYQVDDFIVTHNTELVRQMARLIYGDDTNRLIRFDMSEYTEDTSVGRFMERVSRAIWSNPNSIVLFDEVEKAAPEIIKILLTILDEGRVSDENGRPVSFLNAYIFMTSNLASEVFDEVSKGDGDDDDIESYISLVRDSIERTSKESQFPPEFLGRVDQIVPFRPLTDDVKSKIVQRRLADLKRAVYVKHEMIMKVDPEVITFLVVDNRDRSANQGGARSISALVESHVTSAVSEFVNTEQTKPANQRAKSMRVTMSTELASRNKHALTTDARVVVIGHGRRSVR